MRLLTVAGPPSSGKTSVVLRLAGLLGRRGLRLGAAKFDCLSTRDGERYARHGVPVAVGLAGSLCPDHYFVSNIEDCQAWGLRQGLDVLAVESAGLCNRCSPHVAGVLAVCVIDALAGMRTPGKIGPMLRLADVVAITKADVVSQVEREVLAYNVGLANPGATAAFVNGMTGQGASLLAGRVLASPDSPPLEGRRLRFAMPSGVCPYCVGETTIGGKHQRGNVKKMRFADLPEDAPADLAAAAPGEPA